MPRVTQKDLPAQLESLQLLVNELVSRGKEASARLDAMERRLAELDSHPRAGDP